MSKKQSYQELERQIAALTKQYELLQLNGKSNGETEPLRKEDPNLGKVKIGNQKFSHILLNNMGDSVFIKNDESKLVLVNDAFCKLFNLSRNDIIGKTLAEHVPPNERESFMKIDRMVLANGIENINEETLTVGGITRIISTRKSQFIDSNGNKFLVGVIRDISERKKDELALKESEERFKNLNATKDKLLSIIAHDLRGPFNNIIGLSELLLKSDNFGENDQYEKYIEIINSSAKNTLVLLDNLLNWAKSQTGELAYDPKKIILSEVVHEILNHEKSLANVKNISLEYISKNEIVLHTDENLLTTVLRNLISNAIKFTNFGGKIELLATLNDQQVEIAIIDNGVGMSEAKKLKLFNLSTNLSSIGTGNERGSGLGLILCKEFVEKLGGNIWVESTIGIGSKFTFSLPLSLEA
ncbi:HAMP domain-containing sensor histidine kinase [uncultured Cyclobacterium sp.]|uniref:PAS domain-containing sensor histidine kinase n=1 Tax=uncultured Cyclobacterium sp. TaxID=453820 RepID=UPI0030EDC859|tara:strand:+ start:29873 stop:31111 length:1239 start_codon:yes stop_codon:yes gene_type:complete